MNRSLVPLMAGAIGAGWLGGWLSGALVGPLDGVERLPPLLNLTGGLAFILGAIGFLGVAWYVQRPQVAAAAEPGEASYRPDAWVRAIADVGYAVALRFSRAQSGLLARYAFGSIVAVAVVVLLRVSLR